jgi:hypothetical protein
MRIYQGGTYTFSCSVATSAGLVGVVTTPPLITIFRASDMLPIITSQAMPVVAGASGLYLYRWTPDITAIEDDYIALVSYVTSLQTLSNQFLDKVHVGDARVTDVVARDSTVAKDATVAHDSTVAHASDILAISPTTNATILQILTKVNALPADPASNTVVNTLVPLISDVRDYTLGTWTIDKTQTPNLLSIFRISGTLLKTFRVFENTSTAYRQA